MISMKKAAALALAGLTALSMSACSSGENTKWVAKYDDKTVSAGVYLSGLLMEYHVATTKLTNDTGEMPKNPLQEQLEGVSVSETITTNAKKDLNEYIALEKKFDEMGLKLSEEDANITQAQAESYWAALGPSYTQNGISQESYTQLIYNDAKRSSVFYAIYDEGGTEAVPESELRAKFESDWTKVLMIPLNFSTYTEDEAAKKETDQKTRDLIDKYYKLAKDGGDMEDILFQARQEVAPTEGATQPEKGMSYTFVDRENADYSPAVMEAIFAADLGTPTVVEDEYGIYLFERYDIKENPKDFDSRRLSILAQLKNEDFQAKITEWGKSVDVTYNEEALKRYTPEKLKV